MSQIVIAGGGFAGLSASLFLARRGHAVTIVERDEAPPGDSAEDDADRWRRPGAPQSEQSHVLLARARQVLAQDAPDVLASLLRRGVREQSASVGAGGVEGEAMLLSRRLVAEGVLRRAVECEAGVTVRSGDAVTGIGTRPGTVPIVAEVHTKNGCVLPADLMVDAGGRRSALPTWLAEVGARPLVEEVHPLGFFYLTRYYRVRAGCEAPIMRVPGATALDYATVLAFAGDNDTFSLTIALSVRDPYRSALRDPVVHQRFLEAVPLTAPWIAVGDPITHISMMARIENRRRRLVDDDGPVIGGVVAVGDAALHTNPTLGRGTSMAFWHAQHLANEAKGATVDPIGFVEGFDRWTQDNLGIWFDTQVAADAAGMRRLDAGLAGERLAAPEDPVARLVAAAFACAQTDSLVGDAVAEMVHLFSPPSEVFGRPEVIERIEAFLAREPDLGRPADVPTRAQFEDIARSTPG